MPYSNSSKNFAEDEGCRNDDQYISAQRDDKRRGSLSKSFQCAAGGNRYSGNQEAGADDTESGFSCKYGFCIGGKQSHQLSGNCQADNCSDDHDHAAHDKRYHIDFFHTFVFSCSIVISDHRAHTLDDSAGRKIEEGLKLIINSQNYHIALGVNSKQAVQHGDQKGGERNIQNCRNSHSVKLFVHAAVWLQACFSDAYRNRAGKIDHQVNDQIQDLSKTCCQSSAFNSKGREGTKTENQNRVQYNIGNAAAHQ